LRRKNDGNPYRRSRVMKAWSGILLALVAALAPTLPSFADGAVRSLPTDAAIGEMLVRRVDVQHRGTGAVIILVAPDGRRTISYGTVAADSTRPLNGDTVFGVASITKVFTAILLADMVHRGELGLDDPVARYLGIHAESIPLRDGRAITLADLATHTSGLPLRPSNLVSSDPDNKYDGYTPEMLFAFLSGFVLPRAPGTEYEYSNVGYGLLGQVLTARSGRSYEQILRERIVEPLGMTSTGLDPTPDMKRRSATGYTVEGRAVRDAERGALDAAGAIHSTANDLARLLEAALGLRVSSPGSALQATLATRRPGGMAPWSTQIALAWNVLKTGDREVFWKNGSGGGFRSFAGFDPVSRIGVIGLINVQSDLGVDDIGMHLLGADVPVDMHVPRPHVQVAIDPALLDRYAGRYRYSENDISTFVRDGDRLFYELAPGQRIELLAEGEREFFFKDFDAQITFEVDSTGSATAAIWHQFGQDQRGERIP
jgi:CubicO group peptidase (beta-lactamase class C family)